MLRKGFQFISLLIFLPLDIAALAIFCLVELLWIPFSFLQSRKIVSRKVSALRASLVILTWEGLPLLKEYLPSVVTAVETDGRNHEILVVDNGSTDGTVEYLQEHFPSVNVLPLEKNFGFSEGNNRGVKAARHEIVILLNNDMQADPGFISPLLEGFQDEDTFAVSSQVFFQDKSRRREETGKTRGRWDRGFFEPFHDEVLAGDTTRKTIPILWGGGGSCAFDRQKFLDLGGFDTLFHPFYYEDTDLSYQAWKRGWKVWFAPGSVVLHRHRGTSQRKFGEHFVQNITRKNQYLFVWKNITHPLWLLEHFLWLPYHQARLIRQTSLFFELLAFCRAWRQLPACLYKRIRGRGQHRRSDPDIFAITGNTVPEQGGPSIDFRQTQSSDQLGSGWYEWEPTTTGGYRWTARRCVFFLFPSGRESALELEGNIPELSLYRRASLRLKVFCGEQLLASHRLTQSGSLRWQWPLPKPHQTGPPLKFELRLNATFSPARTGSGTDSRELGILIISLNLV
jgi:GT2 family glycosyltransferase